MRRRSSARATDTLPMHRLFRLNDLALHTLPDTFDERMKWSWWGTYLLVVRTVSVSSYSFIYLMIRIDSSLDLTEDDTRTILRTMVAFFPELPHSWLKQSIKACRYRPCVVPSMMYLSSHHPRLFLDFSIFRQGQARCKPGYQLRDLQSQPSFFLRFYTFFSHFYDNYKPMSL